LRLLRNYLREVEAGEFMKAAVEGAKEEAIFRFGGTDVEVEVAFQREVVAVLLSVDDAGPGRHAGP
jgi:hypothetical protein